MMNNHFSRLLLAAASAAVLVPASAGATPGQKASGRTAPVIKRQLPAKTVAAARPALAVAPLVPVQGGSYGAAMPSAASITRPATDVVIAIGRGQLVSLPSAMKDVFVADEKVADVQVKSSSQLYVYGRTSGETTIYASNAAGAVIWSANVRVASNIDSVDQMLRVAMPDAKISVAMVGANTTLLTGTVRNPEDAAEAERLVKAYIGKDANIITRIRTATPLQVNLQVRIAEVSRSLSKTLQSNLATSNYGNGFQYAIGQGRNMVSSSAISSAALGVGMNPYFYATDPVSGSVAKFPATGIGTLSTATTLAAQTSAFGLNIIAALDAGETAGLVTTLAQPNLTALSGETGEFLAGGEFPIPISSGLGSVSIEYKKYGVSLSFTPTVLSDGRISLRVRPEVSELSSQGSVTLNGFQIPALSIRRAETSVELGSGQSVMLGGLLSNSSTSTLTKLPGAGDVPILGTLFKSSAFKRGETELVIVVTPLLVRPVNDGDIKLPTDGLQNPNDVQRIFGNKMTDGVSGTKRPGPVAAPQEATKPAPEGQAPKARKRNTAANDTSNPGFSLN